MRYAAAIFFHSLGLRFIKTEKHRHFERCFFGLFQNSYLLKTDLIY